jgi:hypothetical protein
MADKQLIPNYVDADFDTMKTRLKTLLQQVDNFQDYDFEGANITVLLELMAYVGDLNTFYTNRLAQNIHTETADIYEVVHSLVRQQGYSPTGYVSSEVVVTIRVRQQDDDQLVTYFSEGNQLYIPRWFKVNTGLSDDAGNIIYYCMSEDFTFDVTLADIKTDYDTDLSINYNYVEFDVTLKQGEPLQAPLEYTGRDIISNQIILPFDNWDMGLYPYEDTKESLLVTVGSNETAWVRVSDFFDELSGLSEENNAYILSYDKYKRAALSFSSTRNIPSVDDDIKVYLIKSLGTDGVIARNTFTATNKPDIDTILGAVEVPFLTNISSATTIPLDRYTVVNTSDSVGGSNPPDIDELKVGGAAYSHSQLRNVTKADYIGNLNSRGDITVSNVWGEQEQNPGVLTSTYYNRAYISAIPTEWATGTHNNINLKEVVPNTDFSGTISTILAYPTNYAEDRPVFSVFDVDTFSNGEIIASGIYTNRAVDTDGAGIGMTVDITIYNQVLVSITVNNYGTGYEIGDTVVVYEGTTGGWSNGTGSYVATIDSFESDIFSPAWTSQLLAYLEPRRMLGIWEEFILPEVIYFRFDFGLKVKRSYSWTVVKEAIKNKLIYYFRNNNKSFGETVDFREVTEYILDLGNVSPTDTFSMVRGIQSLVVRDVLIHRDPVVVASIDNQPDCEGLGGTWTGSCSIIPDEMYIFPDNVYNYYPRFVDTGYFRTTRSTVDDVYNIIQPIKLGHNQFPFLAADCCVFVNEG